MLTQNQHNDLDYLRQTMGWAYWPFCPVKRTVNNELQVGACYDGEKGQRIVYLKNLFSLIDDSRNGITLKDVPSITYANSHDLLVDGWNVD